MSCTVAGATRTMAEGRRWNLRVNASGGAGQFKARPWLNSLRCSNKPSHAVELSCRVGCCSVLGVRFRRSSSTQCTTATCRCAGGSLGRSCGQSQAWSRGLASGLASSWEETLASRPSAAMTDTERARGALHSQQPLRVRSRESGTRVPSQ